MTEHGPRLPPFYSLTVLAIGLGLVGALVYAGLSRWPWAPVLFVGAAAQTVFRVGKRLVRAHLVGRGPTEGGTEEDVSLWEAVQPALGVFTFMVPVCALWYGLGRALAWLLA